MNDAPQPETLPANLRFLRLLVTVLAGVMIAGLLTIVGLLVMRFNAAPAPLPLPEELVLPAGAEARAVTYSADFTLVLTGGDEILVYDRATGELRQTLRID
jgi:hypothetical protein